MADRVEPVLKRVRGDDRRVKFRTGVEIVIVGCDAGGFELPGGGWRQRTERDANFQAKLTDRPDDFENGFELPGAFTDAFPRGPHAEARRTAAFGAARHRQDFVKAEQFFRFHVGVIPGTLGAVRAIFAASPGLEADQCAKLDFVVFPVLEINLAGLLDQVKQRL